MHLNIKTRKQSNKSFHLSTLFTFDNSQLSSNLIYRTNQYDKKRIIQLSTFSIFKSLQNRNLGIKDKFSLLWSTISSYSLFRCFFSHMMMSINEIIQYFCSFSIFSPNKILFLTIDLVLFSSTRLKTHISPIQSVDDNFDLQRNIS